MEIRTDFTLGKTNEVNFKKSLKKKLISLSRDQNMPFDKRETFKKILDRCDLGEKSLKIKPPELTL